MGYFDRLRSGWQSYGQSVGRTAKGLFEYTPMGVAKSNTDKTIAAQRSLAEYQYSKDLEMWERANAYNSPEAQMGRLRAAGLNPNLVYGSGAVGNTSSSLPHYQAPNVQYNYKSPVDLGRLIGLYQDVQMRGAQIDNVKANTAQTLANIDWMGDRSFLTRTQQNKLATEAGTSYLKQEQLRSLMPYSLEMAKLGLSQRKLQMESVASENLFKKYRNEWMRAGVTTSDHPAIRMLIRGWNSGGSNVFRDAYIDWDRISRSLNPK